MTIGKGQRRFWLTAAAVLVACAAPVLAKYAYIWEPIPLDRLLRNMDAKLKASPNDAETVYTLGRLHGLGFLRGAQAIEFRKPGETGRHFPPSDRIREARTAKGKPSAASAVHLRKSISLYSRATQLDPKQAIYQLGLGWMLLQGAGYARDVDWPFGKPGEKRSRMDWIRTAAISLRKAYDLAEKDDLAEEAAWGGQDWAVSLEAGESLLKLYERELAGDRDARAQRVRIGKTVQALNSKPMVVTPIVFPLDRKASLASLIDASRQVRFDLAGDTRSERWPWLYPDAAFLVWDPQHTGKITSGRQLFGSRTWQMFWRHGYQPLAALDDDRSGVLTDKELDGIAVWADRNGNGVSEPGEVVPVSKLGITAIVAKPGGKQGSVWFHAAGVRYSDGGTGPTYDWTPTSVGR